MPDVLIRDVPENVVDALKRRAKTNRRSLQGELLALLERASSDVPDRSPAAVAARIREALTARGQSFTDSTLLVGEDRAR